MSNHKNIHKFITVSLLVPSILALVSPVLPVQARHRRSSIYYVARHHRHHYIRTRRHKHKRRHRRHKPMLFTDNRDNWFIDALHQQPIKQSNHSKSLQHIQNWNKYIRAYNAKHGTRYSPDNNILTDSVNRSSWEKYINKFDNQVINYLDHHDIKNQNSINESYNDDFAKDTRTHLINNINNDRTSNGLAPLSITAGMQKISNQRIQHVAYTYDHYNKFGSFSTAFIHFVHGHSDNTDIHTYSKFDRIHNNYIGENAGTTMNAPLMYYEDSGGTVYNTLTPSGTAHATDDDMMNHDGITKNGHRDNILNRNYHQLGVSVYHANGNSYIDEVFGK